MCVKTTVRKLFVRTQALYMRPQDFCVLAAVAIIASTEERADMEFVGVFGSIALILQALIGILHSVFFGIINQN